MWVAPKASSAVQKRALLLAGMPHYLLFSPLLLSATAWKRGLLVFMCPSFLVHRNQGRAHSRSIHCMMHCGCSSLRRSPHSLLGQETLSQYVHFSCQNGRAFCLFGQHGYLVTYQQFFVTCLAFFMYGITFIQR